MILLEEEEMSTLTYDFRFIRKDLMMLISWQGTRIDITLNIKPECQTLSKAFLMSKRIAVVLKPRFLWVITLSITLRNCKSVL